MVNFHGSVLFSLSHKSQGRFLNKIKTRIAMRNTDTSNVAKNISKWQSFVRESSLERRMANFRAQH